MPMALQDTEQNGETLEDKFEQLKEKCQPVFDEDPSQAHSDASLWRFLRGFHEVDIAYDNIVRCNKWRKEHKVDELNENDEDIQFEEQSGKAVILPHRDKKGRPILCIQTRKHNAKESEIDRLTKFIVFKLEQACHACNEDDGIENLCIVFDLKDFSMSNMDYQLIKNIVCVLDKFYPERLGICLIINAPMIFYGCWTIIRPWFNDTTAAKVSFVSNNKQLSEYVQPEFIPTE